MIKQLFLILGCLAGTLSAHALGADSEQMKLKPTEELTLYIGTYTQHPEGGICGAQFNSLTGELGPARTLVSTSNPSFLALAPNGRFLYAVNEWGQVAGENKGGLSAFRVEPTTGELSPLGDISVGGNLCYLGVDAGGKWLLTTAYGAGTVSTWALLADGSIGPRASLVQYSGHGLDQNRQSEPHAHHIVLSPDNQRAFVADLGTDRVMVDQFDANTGELVPAMTPFVALASGAGPRHLALTPSGQFLYAVSELNNSVTAFRDAPGTPQQIQVVSTLPADFTGQSFAAEIAVRPDGRFLYVSNRGHNSIACYAIETDGQLKLVGFSQTGRNPRHFTFDPSGQWLLAANQNDRSISVFRADEQSGVLTLSHQLEGLPDDPVCLLFGKA